MTRKKPPAPKPSQAERDETDQSLRAERINSDGATRARRSSVEQHADALVERARNRADVLLDEARQLADARSRKEGPWPRGGAALLAERASEDAVILAERTVADQQVRAEREEQARTLASLLPLEREATDRLLLTERARSDVVLANRDDFLGMVSHDLRNLLSGVVIHAATLSEQASASAEGQRTVLAMERIHRYVARMNRLIGDLVDVVSIDAGKLAMVPEPRDARALLSEVVDAFTPAAAEKGISLKAMAAPESLMAEFDHERMLQVMANLLTNALKFTPRGGAIEVRGTRDAHHVRLSVTDNGPGIPEDMLDAVFERFWQVGRNDRRGLGLGLYISKCIVDAHEGDIWAESTFGHGSAFHVTLPMRDATDR